MASATLPVRTIVIDEEDLKEIRSDAWGKQFKPAQLASEGKTVNATFGLRGGHTRNYFKKSYEVRLENGRTLHWNAEFDDPSMMRNALSFHFFNDIGVPSPDTTHIWLVINGEAQGVYLEIEAVDELFFAKRKIKARSLIYAVNDSADFSLNDPDTGQTKPSLFDGYELRQGAQPARTRLVSFIRNLNRRSGSSFSGYTVKRLDVNAYLHWLAGAVLTGNYDGFDQNYALYETEATGRYRIIPWDYEGTWGRNCYGKTCGSDLVRIQGYNRLTRKLFSIPAYRKKYQTLLQKLLNTSFTIDRLEPVIQSMHNMLSPAIRSDYTRKASFDAFLAEPAFIQDYILERRQLIKRGLKSWSQ
jgi:spore coat protein H